MGRSWIIFGRPLESFLLIFHWFLKLFVKIHFFQKISLQEPSWTELGLTWDDFGTQNGANMAPKSDPKTIQKHVNFEERIKSEKELKKNITSPSKNGKRARYLKALKHFLPFGCSCVPFWCSWLPFGCSWLPFLYSWLPVGTFWVALGCLLGASWGLLGASWERLGASWEPLGRLLALFGSIFLEVKF